MNNDDHGGSRKRGRSGGPYSIGELATLGGVSRRTVRYYVQRGLLEAPTGLGRGRHYTEQHLNSLIRIRELQEAGRPLAEIAAELDSANTSDSTDASDAANGARREIVASTPDRISRWTRLEIVDGVELHLRDMRLSARRTQSVVAAIRRIIRQGGQ